MNQQFLEEIAAASAEASLTRDKLQAIVDRWPSENLEAVLVLADANGWELDLPKENQ